jgi:hypothetical protein
MSCVQLSDAQKKKNIYKNTASGCSKAMEFSHIMRNTRFDLTRKNVDCIPIETWTQFSKLLASDLNTNDYLGISVAIYGEYIIGGSNCSTSPYTTNGAVYVYRKNNDGNYGNVLTSSTYTETHKLLASDRNNADYFGSTLVINDDCIVVGAYNKTNSSNFFCGAAYVYKKNPNGSYGNLSGGIVYTETYKLLASDKITADYLGISVAIYNDYIVIGANEEDTTKSNNGAVYVYKKNPNGSYGNLSGGILYTETYKLLASDRDNNDYLGNSVSIYNDYIITGANGENTIPYGDNGAVYVYKKNLDGSYGNLSGGIVYTETYKLLASDKLTSDRFGNSVSIYSDYVVVGAFFKDAGTVYIYKKNLDGSYGNLSGGIVYTETYKLLASDGVNLDRFGCSVYIYSDYIAVGSYLSDTTPNNSNGAVYIYKQKNGFYGNYSTTLNAYTENFKVVANDRDDDDNLGISVSMYENTIVSGAFKSNTTYGVDSGAIYVYKPYFSY